MLQQLEKHLEFENHGKALPLIKRYNPNSHKWVFPQEGPFWSAVKEAHKWGYLGEGKRIGIIDGSFDLEIPRLKAQTEGSIHAWAAPDESKDHGTAVALLIATVAPYSHFDLYEVSQDQKPSLPLVLKALQLAGQSKATLINLSIGRPVGLCGQDGQCELCRSAATVGAEGKLVLAAVGNAEGDAFCPARETSVLGIGFQRVGRTIKETQEGGLAETARWDKPSYAQAFTPDYTLMQPAGVLGSSFAAPLITGALALIDNTSDIRQLLKAVHIGGLAESKHAYLSESAPGEDVEMVKRLYLEALTHLPHRHMGAQSGPSCVACSIFGQNLYVNAGLFFLETGHLDLAEELLSTARWLAPWSPHAAANLATLLRVRAQDVLEQSRDLAESLRLFRASRDEYLYALKLCPNYETYLSGLKVVDEWLRSLPDAADPADDHRAPKS